MSDDTVSRAYKLYETIGLPKEKLFTDISTYVKFHYVYAAPDALILARLEYDNWFVELAVGNMQRFFEVAPFKTEWVGFARFAKGKKESKWYQWEKIKKLTKNHDNLKLQRKRPITSSSS